MSYLSENYDKPHGANGVINDLNNLRKLIQNIIVAVL